MNDAHSSSAECLIFANQSLRIYWNMSPLWI